MEINGLAQMAHDLLVMEGTILREFVLEVLVAKALLSKFGTRGNIKI